MGFKKSKNCYAYLSYFRSKGTFHKNCSEKDGEKEGTFYISFLTRDMKSAI
jgi:hypothetical protein